MTFHQRRLCMGISENGSSLGVWQRIHDNLRANVRQQEGRNPEPTGAIIDSQSVKTTEIGGAERGFDGGKKVKGRKRHILVDILGLVLVVLVHAANISDVTAGRMLLAESSLSVPTLQKVWADRGDRGQRLQQVADGCELHLEVVERSQKSFEVEPRRWVVERTLGWLGRQRGLSKNYEGLPEVSEAVVHIVMISLMLNRLVA